MIEPLALPESVGPACRAGPCWAIRVTAQQLAGLMPGPTFEVFDDTLESATSHLAKQMDMRRHHHVLEHLPVAAPLAMLNGVDDHPGNLRPPEQRVPFRTIQPTFHLPKDLALQPQALRLLAFRHLSQMFGHLPQ